MTARTTSEVSRFRSIHHPGTSGLAVIFARRVVAPFAASTIPVMIVTLVAVLQAQPVVFFLLVGFPLASAIAIGWTTFRLRVTPAEFVIQSGSGEIRSVFDVIRGDSGSRQGPVFDVKKSKHHLEIAIGESTYELSDEDWPELASLIAALQEAKRTVRSLSLADADALMRASGAAP